MTETLKVLGQSLPAANTLTPIYTCGSAFGATCSSITICNQSSSVTAFFNVSVAIGGAADTPAQYIYYQLILDPLDTFIATIGFTLAQTDVVRVLASTASVSFSLFGCELS
jgi:branched-subunit amino acid ABC-type transport system permease component